jgi:hypothetical protein
MMSRESAGFPSGLQPSDYEILERRIAGRKVYKLADVQDRIERVAFDVVRFRDSGGLDKLWVIQEHEGEQVLVAMYDDDEDVQKEATASDRSWAVVPDSTGNLSVFYKAEPIVRLSMKKLGLPQEDTAVVGRYLPEKLASDKDLTQALLKELPSKEREALFAKYPELRG